jgi:hypothetical protein
VPKQGANQGGAGGGNSSATRARQAVERVIKESRIANPPMKELVKEILGSKSHPEIKEDERFAACIASLRRSETGDAPTAPQAASEFVSDRQTCRVVQRRSRDAVLGAERPY